MMSYIILPALFPICAVIHIRTKEMKNWIIGGREDIYSWAHKAWLTWPVLSVKNQISFLVAIYYLAWIQLIYVSRSLERKLKRVEFSRWTKGLRLLTIGRCWLKRGKIWSTSHWMNNCVCPSVQSILHKSTSEKSVKEGRISCFVFLGAFLGSSLRCRRVRLAACNSITSKVTEHQVWSLQFHLKSAFNNSVEDKK